MTAVADPETVTAPSDDRLVQGARWMSLSTFAVGGANYVYSFLLTHLLSAGAYSQFAAGQSLLLTAGTVAVASIPWVLARELGRPGLDRETRRSLVGFAMSANALQGLLAAVVVFLATRSFAGTGVALVAAASAFGIFVGSTPGGWLQGKESFARIAVVRVLEVAVKIAAGLAFAVAFGGAGGPLAGFGLGALALTAAGLYFMRSDLSLRHLGRLRGTGLWRTVAGVASVQGLVSVFASVDVVMVSALHVPSTVGASYQASTVLGRIPLFLGSAVALVAFPLLKGTATQRGRTAGAAFRLYLLTAMPFAIVVASLPSSLIGLLFPSDFSSISAVIRWTAVSGVFIGLIELLTTFYQAEGLYRRALPLQVVGVVAAVVGIPLGWHLDGIVGLAAAATASAALAALVLVIDLNTLWRSCLRLRFTDVAVLAVMVVVLFALRRWPAAWLPVALALLVWRCFVVFFRSHAVLSSPAADVDPGARPKILHLAFEDHARPGSGGGSLRNAEINARLSSQFDITVVTATYPGAQARIENGVTYKHIGLPSGYFPSLLSYFACLPFEMRKHQPDLVIEEFAAPFSSLSVPLFTRRPTLAVVQWLNSREKSRQYKLPFFLFEIVGVRVHKRFVAVSQDIRGRLLAGNSRAAVDVIPNGVDPAAYDADERRGQDVVFLGRLEIAQKGIDLLLSAYAKASLPGQLVLAGDGPDEDRIRAMAADLGISDRVRFAGRVSGEDKFRLLSQARLVAMPSRYETFGIVAVEALACATPVVAFDIDCLHEVIPADCGVLVPSFDVDGYSRALASLHSDDQRVERLGLAGREFARRFDWDDIATAQAVTYLAAMDPVGSRAVDPAGRGRHRA